MECVNLYHNICHTSWPHHYCTVRDCHVTEQRITVRCYVLGSETL